ncbi:uncharacterized protein F5147DRAFT_842601 [Suillus discolor]|uniref:Uncharacterized protein n=1 Tax=Suillus discolor TaxID=1912936 RepID=A0A9P7JL36_9AGAM|nr:uncharacterized protein F5147DRAFT_842601 [Suillus discolor]KAG2080821.1 hypothetical protein F5147DRAFT_842601 [Suillus discolor]
MLRQGQLRIGTGSAKRAPDLHEATCGTRPSRPGAGHSARGRVIAVQTTVFLGAGGAPPRGESSRAGAGVGRAGALVGVTDACNTFSTCSSTARASAILLHVPVLATAVLSFEDPAFFDFEAQRSYSSTIVDINISEDTGSELIIIAMKLSLEGACPNEDSVHFWSWSFRNSSMDTTRKHCSNRLKRLFQLSNHPPNSPIILPQSFLISFSHISKFSASCPPPQRIDKRFSHAFFERISRKLRVLWSYRVFGVFEKLRGDKGFLGAQRPVSFSSFGHLPSFSGSVHCPNLLLDRTSPCCPAPYPFLLLPLAPPHFFALSPAHFALEPHRPYTRFEALIHGFHSRPSPPRSAPSFAHHLRFPSPPTLSHLFHHFIYISSPFDRAPIDPILILTAFAAAFHPSDPLPDTSARSSAIRHSRVSLHFPPFPSFLTQFSTNPSRPYTHFEALVRLFLSVYSPSSPMQPSSRFYHFIVAAPPVLKANLPGIRVKETKGV